MYPVRQTLDLALQLGRVHEAEEGVNLESILLDQGEEEKKEHQTLEDRLKEGRGRTRSAALSSNLIPLTTAVRICKLKQP